MVRCCFIMQEFSRCSYPTIIEYNIKTMMNNHFFTKYSKRLFTVNSCPMVEVGFDFILHKHINLIEKG